MTSDFKKTISDNVFIIAILLFSVLFVIINYEQVVVGELANTNVVKPVLLTGIIVLILLIITTWDDECINTNQQEQVVIPKYRLANINDIPKQNPSFNVASGDDMNLQGNSKFQLDSKPISNPNPVENKLSNNSIFISHKNAGKYGIKF
jgi:hypothetical protein